MTEDTTTDSSNPFMRSVTAVHNELISLREGVLVDLQVLATITSVQDYNESVKEKLYELADLDYKISTIVKYFSNKANEEEGDST